MIDDSCFFKEIGDVTVQVYDSMASAAIELAIRGRRLTMRADEIQEVIEALQDARAYLADQN